MTDEPARLKRNRHRVLVAVTVVAVMMIGLWWAGRPQIDPRLIGKWRYKVDLATPYVYELKKNGSGSITSESNNVAIHWRSDGEAIYIDRTDIGRLLRLLPRKVRLWMQEPGGPTVGGGDETRYEVLDAGPDSVTLQMTPRAGRLPPPFTWIRAPE